MLLLTATALAQSELSIPYEMHTLENGLTVILAEDHSVPVVQVNVWYHVGSKDEVEGRTGFAHLFEHLMFQGSENNNEDYFTLLQEVGGSVNGTTNMDRTNYFEGVPAAYLPLALWAEADRMGFLILDEDALANQQDVVRNERRQRVENPPYGDVWMTLLAEVFPSNHPYHHPTIGSHEDLEAATMEDVQGFYDTWYTPNNAVVVIAGDFDPEQALELVEDYFGELEPGPETTPTVIPAFELAEDKVIRKEDENAPTPKLWIAWHSPALYAPGDAELDLFSSYFAQGKESPLYGGLVLEQQIAVEASAYQASFGEDSMYVIEATPVPGVTTDQLVEAIDEILAGVLAEGVPADALAIGQTQYEVSFLHGLETVAAKANKLNSYYYFTGEPDYLQKDLDRYLDATPDTVLEAAQTTLGGHRVVLHVAPPAPVVADEPPPLEDEPKKGCLFGRKGDK
jgi:zinc protease